MLIKKFISIIIFIMFCASFAYSVDLSLKSYTPDPAVSNSFVYVDVLVSNLDDVDVENLRVEYIENKDFIVQDNKHKTIGILEEKQTITLKYKFFIENSVNSGINTISFKTNKDDLVYEFDILVQDDSPKVYLSDFKTDNLVPGSSTNFSFKIKNTNDVEIKDIFINLDVLEIEDNILNFYKDSNNIFIKKLSPNEEKILNYNILIKPQAEAKPYILPITISYEDTLNNLYNQTYYTSLNVYSKPNLILDIESYEDNTINLALANVGTSNVKSVQIKVLESSDYNLTQAIYTYVGDLNPDDYEVLQTKLDSFDDNPEIKFELTYYDSYNKMFSEIKTFKINNFSMEKEERGNTFLYIIIVLVISAIGFFYFRRKNKNKK